MMGIISKYCMSVNSSNLKCDEYHFDTDNLAAVALSGSAADWPHSNMLLRVKYAGDVSSYQNLMDEWRERVKIKAALRGWPIDVSASKVARLSLDHWLNNVCPVCHGRGHLQHAEIVNVLSDDPCPVCKGTAIRSVELRPSMIAKYASPTVCAWFPHVRPTMLIKYVQDMIEDLELLTIRAGGAAFRKLATDMENIV